MGEYLFIGSAILSLVNGTVLLAVNPARNVNRVFFCTAGCIALWALGIAMAIREGAVHPSDPNPNLIFWLRVSSVAGAFLGWCAWLMRTAILAGNSSFQGILRRSWVFFYVSLLAATIAASETYIPSSSTPQVKQRGIGFAVYTVVATASCLWMLVDALKQLRVLTGVRKIEMQFFLLSIVGACLLLIVSNLAGCVEHMEWLKQISPLWFLALHAIAIWAVCYHKVFDAKHVILSAGQRCMLFGVLAAGTTVLSSALSQFTSLPWAVFFATGASCAVAASLDGPIRRLVGLDPELMLQMPRRTIIDKARQHPEEDRLKTHFEKLLCDWSQTRHVEIILTRDRSAQTSELPLQPEWKNVLSVSKGGWTTPEALQRKRATPEASDCLSFMSRHTLGVLLAVPKESTSPSLVIAFAQKESLRPYTFPDIQMLLELAELMDNILTHSRVAAHAAQIERMETASMMSRGLAHDLSNLATPVATFLTHMGKRVVPGTTESEVLADAKHSIGVMQRYIQESLFFSRALTLKIEPIEVSQLMTSVVRLSQDRAKTHDVEVEIRPSDDFIFWADPALVQRLMQNLIFNAIDASPRKGRIELSAFSAANSQVIFKVHDHGSGIPLGMTDRIFEPYFTTKQSGSTLRGLGLGLAICRKITDLHRGSISVACDEKSGTVFTVNLPEKQEGQTAATASRAKGEAHIGTGLASVAQSI